MPPLPTPVSSRSHHGRVRPSRRRPCLGPLINAETRPGSGRWARLDSLRRAPTHMACRRPAPPQGTSTGTQLRALHPDLLTVCRKAALQNYMTRANLLPRPGCTKRDRPHVRCPVCPPLFQLSLSCRSCANTMLARAQTPTTSLKWVTRWLQAVGADTGAVSGASACKGGISAAIEASVSEVILWMQKQTLADPGGAALHHPEQPGPALPHVGGCQTIDSWPGNYELLHCPLWPHATTQQPHTASTSKPPPALAARTTAPSTRPPAPSHCLLPTTVSSGIHPHDLCHSSSSKFSGVVPTLQGMGSGRRPAPRPAPPSSPAQAQRLGMCSRNRAISIPKPRRLEGKPLF